MITRGKARLARTPATAPPVEGGGGAWTAKTTFLLVRSLIKLADSPGRSRVSWRLPSLSIDRTCLPSEARDTFSIWPASTASRNVEYAHGVELGPVTADAPWAVIPVSVAPRRPASCARLAGTISITGDVRMTAVGWLGARTGRAENASTLSAAPTSMVPRICVGCPWRGEPAALA